MWQCCHIGGSLEVMRHEGRAFMNVIRALIKGTLILSVTWGPKKLGVSHGDMPHPSPQVHVKVKQRHALHQQVGCESIYRKCCLPKIMSFICFLLRWRILVILSVMDNLHVPDCLAKHKFHGNPQLSGGLSYIYFIPLTETEIIVYVVNFHLQYQRVSFP
jgi:hypothetical protein